MTDVLVDPTLGMTLPKALEYWRNRALEAEAGKIQDVESPRPHRQRFEYRLEHQSVQSPEFMDRLAEDGWEVHTVTPTKNDYVVNVMFARRVGPAYIAQGTATGRMVQTGMPMHTQVSRVPGVPRGSRTDHMETER